jgi:hypothetical protein
MLRLSLAAVVGEPDIEVSVYVPGVSMLQPLKLDGPEEAGFGLFAQVSVAPAGMVVHRVTEAVPAGQRVGAGILDG